MQTRRQPSVGAADALAPLRVIDRLEVGPVELTSRTCSAAYRVTIGGETSATKLAFRYAEDVFDPSDLASRNLASMIVAQVALNYGLFVREIEFRGLYESRDRELLGRMAANTAREIFVHKILRPNPFLVRGFGPVPPARLPSYLQAQLSFPDADESDGFVLPTERWFASPERVAVLSSGGKESLLSYGLLDEVGCDAHAIFVNESGRHWYTALNGYRLFASQRADQTTRVWTSADRVYSWFLRHLPFVRTDFHRLRSDEYPIRLWTVAVFLFATLPVVRKRGIGRVAVGNEFDTTRRRSHLGITHYDALYDQSRFFDETLSSYYRRKGWGVEQFSLVRPLSELLVQKTLSARYPDLLQHQMSCHAAHLANGRAYPCGRCEKCRRVVAMQTALKLDPAVVGYTREQVADCLAAFEEQGAHQEAAGVRHVRWLLQQITPPTGGVPRRALRESEAPAPEVMHLRFAETESPWTSIPAELRGPVYEILSQHAEGTLRRVGSGWLPWSPSYEERGGGCGNPMEMMPCG